ncbi:MAG: ketopantoate reductase family protein [Gemmatimonadaceae bacterium]
MKILILGAGGIGGYVGGRLAASGADVTFLVRPRRKAQLEADGLVIRSPLGDVQLPVKTVLAPPEADFDIVLLTCKAYDLEPAMEAIAPAMNGQCAIVPMLNGIAHLDRLDERFGQSAVMGGTCLIDVALDRSGTINHAGSLQRIIFGERDRSISPRAQALAGVLAQSTVDWEMSDNILLSMWEKVAFLSVLAAATCLFRANVREILASPGGRDAMERALAVNIEIAKREGFILRNDVMQRARDRLTDPAGAWSASMLRDLEAGGSVEGDHVVGWMLAKARKHGLDDTILSLAFTHLRAYEERRAAGRLPAG